MQCELCGSTGHLTKARIEGVILTVCNDCSTLGTVLAPPPGERRKVTPLPKQETLYTIREGYPLLIKHKRETLGVTQEDFAKKINEKISVIHHLESGKLEPSIELAKKLERALGLRLVEENQLVRESEKSGKKGIALTIGDIIQLKK